MEIYGAGGPVQVKADQSPLTAADLVSHTLLMRALAELKPSLPVISEEGDLSLHEERSQWAGYWLVDPLDGTKEFLERNGEFTVNVALIEQGRPTLGVVGVPATGVMFVGVAGARAERVEPTGERRPLRCRAYSGSQPTVVGSRRHGTDRLAAALERLQREQGPLDLRTTGSSLKFCLLAEGLADVYPRLGPTSEWDTAAAQAVLEAAGGAVYQLNGDVLAYSKADILNPSFVAVADRAANWVQWFR